MNRPFSPLRWSWPAQLRLNPVVWAFALAVAVFSWFWLPNGGFDWREIFAPAARQWWPAPWSVANTPLPPWATLLTSPLAGLPARAATALINGGTVIALALVANHLGGPDWVVIPVMITPAGISLLENGQLDGLVLMGLLVFNGLDILLLVIKPQTAVGAIVPRLRRAGANWIRYLAPAAIFGLASLVIWFAWPLRAYAVAPSVGAAWNRALWPWGLPLGAFLLWRAWQTGEDWLGVAASPFLFPFVNWHSYLGLFIAVGARYPRLAIAVSLSFVALRLIFR